MTDLDLHIDQTTELAETFGLLADPTRLSIVIACMDQERSAGDIAEKLGSSASLTSHHLRLLRSARILKSERRGKQVFYSMADACVHSVLKIMIEHLFTHGVEDIQED
ncbi:MAG: metalloregulator ArsR/SmtB family transcription factor [Pseudomonadota bacterium]